MRFSATSPVRFGGATFTVSHAGVKPEDADASNRAAADSGKGDPATEDTTANSTSNSSAASAIPIVKSAGNEPRATETKPQTGARAQTQEAKLEEGDIGQPALSSHHPSELAGLKSDKVTELLGSPNLVRHDAPAQIWQYRSGDCVLDIFLYPPSIKSGSQGAAPRDAKTADGVEPTVVYYEMRGKKAEPVSADRCFSSLVGAAHLRHAG